jgi:hypothetical protein
MEKLEEKKRKKMSDSAVPTQEGIRNKTGKFMTYFLRVMAVLYFFAGLLHLADVLDLRLLLSQMSSTWKIWICSLLVLDFAAAFGLWFRTIWGQVLFVFIASTQIIVYLSFESTFGPQWELVVFHACSLVVYVYLLRRRLRPTLKTSGIR